MPKMDPRKKLQHLHETSGAWLFVTTFLFGVTAGTFYGAFLHTWALKVGILAATLLLACLAFWRHLRAETAADRFVDGLK